MKEVKSNQHDQVKRENRIWIGRYVIFYVLEDIRSIPDDILYRRFWYVGSYCRYDVRSHPYLGFTVRPRCRCHCRPYRKPLGKVPSLSALSGIAIRYYRHLHFYDAAIRHNRQSDLRLHHLHPDDDGIQRHQRALCLATWRDEPPSI